MNYWAGFFDGAAACALIMWGAWKLDGFLVRRQAKADDGHWITRLRIRESWPDETPLVDRIDSLHLINRLRQAEGNSVTILCDNPDFNGRPANAIEVCAEWTDWKERRFTGDTVLAALRSADAARFAWQGDDMRRRWDLAMKQEGATS